MTLAICIAVKNRSNLRVIHEDPIQTYKHIESKLQLSPTDDIHSPIINNDNTISLHLLPNLLHSLVKIHEKTDDWKIILVDYESTDVNMKTLCETILEGKIPYILHIVSDTFSRGSGLDLAAKIARNQGISSLFFCDADMYFTRRYIFERAYEALANNRIFYPVCFSFTQVDHQRGYWRDSGYGMVFMNTDVYFNSSRWKHNVSWGYEDNDLYKNFSNQNIVRLNCPGYFHQWHPNSIEFKTLEYPIKTYIGRKAVI